MEQGIKHKEGKNSLEIDWTFIRHLGERMDANKGQYPRYNWKKPMEDPIELIDAIMRHAIAIQEGELEDDGREFGHIEAIACDAMMFFAQMVLKKKKDFEKELIKQFGEAYPLVLSNDPTGQDKKEEKTLKQYQDIYSKSIGMENWDDLILHCNNISEEIECHEINLIKFIKSSIK